jgi:hypothetical protein
VTESQLIHRARGSVASVPPRPRLTRPSVLRTLLACVAGLAFAGRAQSAEFVVGPGERFATPDRVPWDNLQPGDVVAIHWRPQPYRCKFILCGRGRAEAPITVRGVPGPQGELPVLDGENAITPPALDYWAGERGVIKVGPARFAPEAVPGHLVVENLEIRNARPGCFFASRQGLLQYSEAAAAIYVERGDHVTVRNCVLHGCGNGFFTAFESAEILLEGCHIHDNGMAASIYQHNAYTESAGIVYQHNRFGPLRSGALGNNIKDRSAGLVIRYNWIEGGNRQLDLVDAEEGEAIRQDPRYERAYVYGNVLIETDDSGNNQVVHFGGDNGPEESFRHGPLFFFNNTVVSERTDKTLTTADPSLLSILDETGLVVLANNVIRPGWRRCHGDLAGQIRVESNWETDERVLIDVAARDFRPCKGSAAIDRGRPPPERHPVDRQFRAPFGDEPRPPVGPLDIGAFENAP